MANVSRRLLVGFATLSLVSAEAHEVDFRLGAGGWTLEHFGSDVTVLRARASTDPPPAGEVSLFLSCAGTYARLRLTMTVGASMSTFPTDTGRVLIRARQAGADPGAAVQAHFRRADPRSVFLFDPPNEAAGMSLAFARLLRSQPPELDMLVSADRDVALSRIRASRIAVSWGVADSAALQAVAAACMSASQSAR